LVLLCYRRSISELRDRQYFIRAVLCSRAQGASQHPREIASGEFGTLHTWLRDNLYRHGSMFVPIDLVERATGAVLHMRPYFDYLHEKYGALYRLPPGSDQNLKAH
jgi:hypothetical protein